MEENSSCDVLLSVLYMEICDSGFWDLEFADLSPEQYMSRCEEALENPSIQKALHAAFWERHRKNLIFVPNMFLEEDDEISRRTVHMSWGDTHLMEYAVPGREFGKNDFKKYMYRKRNDEFSDSIVESLKEDTSARGRQALTTLLRFLN